MYILKNGQIAPKINLINFQFGSVKVHKQPILQ
jgi:hypothetical protein